MILIIHSENTITHSLTFCSVFQIMSRIIPIYTDACHCLTVDSDNTHLLPILRADKCMSVNGNKAVLLDSPSQCSVQ